MPRVCAVAGCGNRCNKETINRFFGFPTIRDSKSRIIPQGMSRRKLWVEALKITDLTNRNLRFMAVCADHFLFGRPAAADEVDHPDYVPSLNLDLPLTSNLLPKKRSKCCVPNCPTNNGTVKSIRTFKFPKDEKLRQQWIKAIPHYHHWQVHSLYNRRICILHFRDAEVDKVEKYINKGEEKEFVRSRPILCKGVVPSIFTYAKDEPERDMGACQDIKVESGDPLTHPTTVRKRRRNRKPPEFAKVYVLDNHNTEEHLFYDESEHTENSHDCQNHQFFYGEEKDVISEIGDNHCCVEIDVGNDHTYCKRICTFYETEDATRLLHEEVDIKEEPLMYDTVT